MKGFIERIEEENVYVVFEDETKVFHLSQFPSNVTIDMEVELLNGKIKVYPPDENISREIEKITDKIFVSFKDRIKKK